MKKKLKNLQKVLNQAGILLYIYVVLSFHCKQWNNIIIPRCWFFPFLIGHEFCIDLQVDQFWVGNCYIKVNGLWVRVLWLRNSLGFWEDCRSRIGNLIFPQFCDYCDPKSTLKKHPAEYAVDGRKTWWQSPPLSRGMSYNEVNLTIDLGQVRY